MSLVRAAAIAVATAALCACGGVSQKSIEVTQGPKPEIDAPDHPTIPTVNVAKAVGWNGQRPQAADGMAVTPFAEGLDHPRWLAVMPNGDVLVAETNGPERPDDSKGIKAKFQKYFQKRAGAGGESPDRIVILRDADGDGHAEIRETFLDKLRSPFGMVLVGNDLYVADTDALLRYHYTPGDLRPVGAAQTVCSLPGGPLNHHWTKNVIANADGSKLYVTVGSNSNVAENGIDKEGDRARILEIDPKTGAASVFATGLRNPNGMAWEGDVLWTVVNERDELGNDLVPDYLTSVKQGAFYGWPYSYYGDHTDARVKPQKPELVRTATVPDYALGAHTASLGLTSSKGAGLGGPFAGDGMFIGQHGSWNRKPLSGYKVIFVPFADGRPAGQPIDVLTGFVDEQGEARGRPVGVAVDTRGGLLVADDVGNAVWRVGAAGAGPAVPTSTAMK